MKRGYRGCRGRASLLKHISNSIEYLKTCELIIKNRKNNNVYGIPTMERKTYELENCKYILSDKYQNPIFKVPLENKEADRLFEALVEKYPDSFLPIWKTKTYFSLKAYKLDTKNEKLELAIDNIYTLKFVILVGLGKQDKPFVSIKVVDISRTGEEIRQVEYLDL